MNILTSAPQTPKMNAHCERVVRTLRTEVCDHILILNEAHAREVLAEHQRHYNQHRPTKPVNSDHPTVTSSSTEQTAPLPARRYARPSLMDLSTSTTTQLDLQR
jgi:putative transposase